MLYIILKFQEQTKPKAPHKGMMNGKRMTANGHGMKTLSPAYDQSFIARKLLEEAFDGIVVVDGHGTIILLSKAYADFLGVRVENAIGRHVTEVVPNTRLPVILKNGKREDSQLQLVKGEYMISTRIPLIKDGRVIGAIGKIMFRNIGELEVLYAQIKQLHQKIAQFSSRAEMKQAKYSFAHIVGDSDKLLLAKAMAEKAGLTDSTVLLTGESGTGKELFAHAIHQSSGRAAGPFIKINCAAIPSELLESELFGYEEGAFTGARKGGKIGKFEAADGGTLFLDEIGDMPAGMQAKLLRVLQEQEVERIGASCPVKVNVRIIAATNRDLLDMMAQRLFRSDLYYRLNVLSIRIPALRERPADIELLVPSLLDKICSRLGKYIEEVSPQAMRFLTSYSWPGNVRQLQNVLENAVCLLNGKVITPRDLPESITGMPPKANIGSLDEILAAAEAEAIVKALQAAGGKKAKAARLLQISRSNLYTRMHRLHLR